jgi:hypothetical protein
MLNSETVHVLPQGSSAARVEARLAEAAVEGPAGIELRLQQIQREWSRDRAIGLLIGVLSLLGLAIAWFAGPWGLLLTGIAGLLLIQNALMSPSLLGAGLSSAGWRSEVAIEQERAMLKAIRGDFDQLQPVVDEEDRIAIARLEEEGGVVDAPEISVPVNRQAIREVIETVQRGSTAE